MGDGIGFSDQTPALPQGGGAIGGLGATFTPDLSTGTGSFSIPLDAPNGSNDIGPKLGLRYDTGAGNGPFGVGFSLPLPRIIRDTVHGYPTYAGGDTLVLEGAGPLVDLGGGAYRPQVDGGAWHAEANGAGFRLIDRQGWFYDCGVTAGGQLADPTDAGRIFAWHLERISDPLGNSAAFTWQRDRGQLYLASVAYGGYELVFAYEGRPDVFRFARAGFSIVTGLRCQAIELHLTGAAQPLLRRWLLDYTSDTVNGASLLRSVVLRGFDASGGSLDAPPLSLRYSTFGAARFEELRSADDSPLPALAVRPTQRVEIVDWNGDGLPDLIEIGGGGTARVHLNRGDSSFAAPRNVGRLPQFSQPDATIAFADMDGDGVADLVRVDQPLSGYVPRIEGGGFGFPVRWRFAPSISPAAARVRLVDLDGDGMADLLASASGHGLALYYRDGADGWRPTPQIVSGVAAPPVDLGDPHIFLADMTGDGSADLVRVDGGGVTYWPYLGRGRWDAPVTMANPPQLPFNVQVNRIFVSDVDGDGCADVIYLADDSVVYWANQSGNGFGAVVKISYVPGAAIGLARLADMTGGGTPGLLWSTTGPLGRGTRYFYLDFSGSSRPRLVTQIDNGVGLTTAITYTTSAQEAARAAALGDPWTTSLPLALSIVATITTSDAATGRSLTKKFQYHDGRFDGIFREFAGFGQVVEDDIGDATIATLRTTTWFHIGIDPANPRAPLDAAGRHRLRAIRGRLYKRERHGLDGTPQSLLPYDRLEQIWQTDEAATVGGPVELPKMLSQTQTNFERGVAAVVTITTVNSAWDANGNVTDTTQTAAVPDDPSQTRSLRTVTTYANDPAGRFLSLVARVQQYDTAGTLVADTITLYDGQPQGTVGKQGLVTKRSALAIDDATVAGVYGPQMPDFAALHYYRPPGATGWWIDQGTYARTDNASGLHGIVTGPNGASLAVTYDATKCYPASLTDPMGNTISAVYDYRVSRAQQVTDPGGAVYTTSFDALARIVARVEPDDTAALPTLAYTYDTTHLPLAETARARAVSGGAATIDTITFYDGDGNAIEGRISDATGSIAVNSRAFNGRGLIIREFVEYRPAAATYAKPADTIAHTAHTYDALGRPLSRAAADGSVHSWSYGPRTVDQTDAAGKTVRQMIDPTGRVVRTEEHLAERTLTTTYAYDIKGNLLIHTDAAGNVVRSVYDALGRVLRVQRPEHDATNVYDAVGNAVEARGPAGTLVTRTFDGCNRPVGVSYPGSAAEVIHFTYHDASAPAPVDAGTHTAGGRCVRIDDQAGSTVFDYDARGRTAMKRNTPAGQISSYQLDLAYRADGKIASITYPRGGAGRLVLPFQYDSTGRVNAIPGVVSRIDYDVGGRRVATHFANGATTTRAYDPATHALTQLTHTNATGDFRAASYTWDPVGNLTAIASPNPAVAASLAYDDLHRLVSATPGAGAALTCAYDDVGNLTQKSDVGVYSYGDGGAPATCLTAAGPTAFTYTPLGQVASAPWGTHSYDNTGRLVAIAGAINAAFTYDYTGSRVSAIFVAGGTSHARITADPFYAIEDGTLIRYLFDGERFVARDADAAGRTYLHEDHLGSIVAFTDLSGNVVDEVTYDAFGAVVSRTAAGATTPIGFAGGEFDTGTGLIYLKARYYSPHFGRFLAVDPIVQDVYTPIAWNAYAYCRNNPQSYIDPSGRSWWQILVGALAVIAIVALVVVSILTFGATTPLLIVAIGVVAGGVIGGIAAAQAKGDIGDIILGVLVGAAVGGWAAFASVFAGGAVASALGIKGSLAGAIVAGAVNGAINGAAMGFAAGFAGGKTTLDELLKKVALGALVGAVVGGALGGVSYSFAHSPAPTESLGQQIQRAATQPAPIPDPGAAGSVPSGIPAQPPVEINDPLQAAQTVGGQYAAHVASPIAEAAARYAFTSPFASAISTLLVDGSAGVFDLGVGLIILQKIGVVKIGGKF